MLLYKDPLLAGRRGEDGVVQIQQCFVWARYEQRGKRSAHTHADGAVAAVLQRPLHCYNVLSDQRATCSKRKETRCI